MTLDEAIKHCKEKAKELRTEAEQLRDIGEVISSPKQPYNEPVKDCIECANEHEQLAEWLKDYKRLLGEKSYAMGYQDGAEDGLQGIRTEGKWIYHRAQDEFLPYMECDNCHEEFLLDMLRPTEFRKVNRFCSHCGSDMRRKKNG